MQKRASVGLAMLLLLAAAANAEPPRPAGSPGKPAIKPGSGQFTIAGGAGREARTIDVHYYRPPNLTSDSPVLVVVPGAGRNGDDYRDAWIESADEHGVLVLSPSYSEKHYPEFWNYNLAGMPASVSLDLNITLDTSNRGESYVQQAESLHDDTLRRLSDNNRLLGQLAQIALASRITDIDARANGVTVNRDRSAWIYSDFDRIFGIARETLDLNATRYDLFGHSAGGQILHRFALFHPDNRANRIVAANSGWYTLPDFKQPFPYGLADTGMTEAEIAQAFQSNLIVFLGEKDDEHETRGSLRKTPEAMQQGPGRIQRGKYFFESTEKAAEEMNTELHWRLEVVPGVGHEYRKMAEAAAGYLYDGERPPRNLE